MGGTWGARTDVFSRIGALKGLLAAYVAKKGAGSYGSDIEFLCEVLWKDMKAQGVVQHDSHSCR